MTTLEELATSWDEKAAHWRRTAKQQRSACRTREGTKLRLMEKAQLAEDCARELRAVMVESAKLFDGGPRGKNPSLIIVDEIQQDTPALKAKSNRRINNSVGVLKSDPTKRLGQFLGEVERAATLVDSESREPTVDGGARVSVDLAAGSDATAIVGVTDGKVGRRRPDIERQLRDLDIGGVPTELPEYPLPPAHKGSDSAA